LINNLNFQFSVKKIVKNLKKPKVWTLSDYTFKKAKTTFASPDENHPYCIKIEKH